MELQRVMQLLHHTELAVMTAQRAQAWRDISKVSRLGLLLHLPRPSTFLLLRNTQLQGVPDSRQHRLLELLFYSFIACKTFFETTGPVSTDEILPSCHHCHRCVTDVFLMCWQMQKLHEGQPVDAAERDRVLRLPITLPSNYLCTAIQQFQVSCPRKLTHIQSVWLHA